MYWANLKLLLDYVLPSVVVIPSIYLLTRLLNELPGTREIAFVRAVFQSWHNSDWYRVRLSCCLVMWLDIVLHLL